MARDDIRIRLRHNWVTLMAFPMTEEQAQRLASGDQSELAAAGPLDVKFSQPYCERCHLDFVSAPYSCPGGAVRFSPDGAHIFGPYPDPDGEPSAQPPSRNEGVAEPRDEAAPPRFVR